MADRDKRLIEDYLPIEAISTQASSEPRSKGHISTLHLWRARRPLVACRAAVYGSLVSASQFVPNGASDEKKQSLGRANAAKFVERLCQYPGSHTVISAAQEHILAAHAERLTKDTHEKVAIEDIVGKRAARPRVLDMFAGGGAIPLEAARLGCESHAVELNPVAYLIGLCTATFPQQFGPDLADDVDKWGRTVLENTEKRLKDLFARIPNQDLKTTSQDELIPGHSSGNASKDLSIVAYYWTRTVPCANPICRGTVPLYRQSWLRRKESGYTALKPEADRQKKVVRFRVVEAVAESALDFDPGDGSEGSSTVCPFCPATVSAEYVRAYGNQNGFGLQLMCVIALNPFGSGKLYLADESLAEGEAEREAIAEERARDLERELGATSLDELIPPTGNAGLDTGKSYLYGIRTFRQAFTPRQRLTLLSMAREVRRAHEMMLAQGIDETRARAISTYLGIWVSRIVDRCNSLCRWNSAREVIQGLTDT